MNKEQINTLAEKTWEVVTNQLPNGINPTPFILGFKYGYGEKVKKEAIDFLIYADPTIPRKQAEQCYDVFIFHKSKSDPNDIPDSVG